MGTRVLAALAALAFGGALGGLGCSGGGNGAADATADIPSARDTAPDGLVDGEPNDGAAETGVPPDGGPDGVADADVLPDGGPDGVADADVLPDGGPDGAADTDVLPDGGPDGATDTDVLPDGGPDGAADAASHPDGPLRDIADAAPDAGPTDAPPSDAPPSDADAVGDLPAPPPDYPYPLPAGSWLPVGAGPLPNVPAGCGGPELPCNRGGFDYRWPADDGAWRCSNGTAPLPCAGEPGSPECADTAGCGQDAQYGPDATGSDWARGRFEVLGEPGALVVRDQWTGLWWQGAPRLGLRWAEARDACASLAGLGGRDDWRLPDVPDLLSLADFGVSLPASVFPGMPAESFWAAATAPEAPADALRVNFRHGSASRAAPKSEKLAVRCVAGRSAGFPATPRFYVTPDAEGADVVFDRATGLFWQRHQPLLRRGWLAALAYCEALDYGGRSDWRLPNVLELASLLDNTRVDPAIDPAAFPNADATYTWTSTSYAGTPATPWYVFFGNGHTYFYDAGLEAAVRCVAGSPLPGGLVPGVP